MAAPAPVSPAAPAAVPAAVLWRHPNPEDTPMYRFLQTVNAKYGLKLADYADLHSWSVENVAAFWATVWDEVGVLASRPFDAVLPITAKTAAAVPVVPMFPRPDFFAGARLNFAENLLFPVGENGVSAVADPAAPALITVTEDWTDAAAAAAAAGGEEGAAASVLTMSWTELREAVRRCSAALRQAGISLRHGDVVAGYVGNHATAVVAMLTATAAGAVWTSISPDTGVSAVLDRLVRVRPRVLFADSVSSYNGKAWSGTAKTLEIATALSTSLEAVLVVGPASTAATGRPHPTQHAPSSDDELGLPALRAKFAVAEEYGSFLAGAPSDPLRFEQLPPSHPVYLLYSSGTTGLPKAIVHTAAGTLLQHKKEHVLHGSLGPRSRMLYYTTTSWMMWHWSVSALAAGASLVLYTGSPFRPFGHLSMPRLLSALHVTHFGTSAAYLVALESNQVRIDGSGVDLSALQAIYSTASPLPPSTFAYVYDAIAPHVHLASITGGTDIVSLFGAPCPLLPVVAGAVQCAGLGMAVAVADSASPPEAPILLAAGQEGDLVCTQPFPCQPLTFYGDDGPAKYQASYFERFPGWWHHGDFVRLDEYDCDNSGRTRGQSLVMLGRSDGVLKPAGVRFGSAEIYNVLTKFFAAEIDDALCVGRRRPHDTDETVCLFVVVPDGAPAFNENLRRRIQATIRRELSPRHVPAIIEACGRGIPRTNNGKKIEVAVKQILSGRAVHTNTSVANPEALEWFREWAAVHNH